MLGKFLPEMIVLICPLWSDGSFVFGGFRRRKEVFGDHSGGDTPGSMPNPAVKPSSADGTAGGTRGRVGRCRKLFPSLIFCALGAPKRDPFFLSPKPKDQHKEPIFSWTPKGAGLP